MSYYHILIEMNDHISTIEQTREIEIFDILEIQPYLHSILLPFLNEQLIELEDENLEFSDILHLEIKQTLLPIQHLIEEEQRLLPSDTDVTISAHEIFNNRDLSQDVTTVIFDILEAGGMACVCTVFSSGTHASIFFGPIYPRMLCSLSPFARRSCSISFCVNSFLSYSFAFVSVSEENSCIFLFSGTGSARILLRDS